jgi:hypothetical protein
VVLPDIMPLPCWLLVMAMMAQTIAAIAIRPVTPVAIFHARLVFTSRISCSSVA